MGLYRVLEKSFIDNAIREPGDIVEVNDDPAQGGMTPGPNLVAVGEDHEPVAARGARRRKIGADEGSDGLA